jgi:hypothetical protein
VNRIGDEAYYGSHEPVPSDPLKHVTTSQEEGVCVLVVNIMADKIKGRDSGS